MKSIETPQSRCWIGLSRTDITPPIGIYNRMWGAALHDCATAVHRPLFATALWLQPLDRELEHAQLILTLDHCLLDSAEMLRLRRAACRLIPLDPTQVHICLSHTHGSGYLSRSRSTQPGGDLIGPDLDALADKCAWLAATASEKARQGIIVYGVGRCALAAHRDYWDEEQHAYVCGYNPAGPTDDTLVVARLIDDDETLIGTLVNYACHPTTLAWENTAISPDFVGAMREVIERETQAPCLFLQGASGDLGPREGFVGDWQVADRNGRQLGFAALATLESLPPAGTRYVYAGSVMSGTGIGTWAHQLIEQAENGHTLCESRRTIVPLAYRSDLPSLDETRRQLVVWRERQREAMESNHMDELRVIRARVEQLTRQYDRLASLPAGEAYPYPVSVLRLGGACWVFVPGELYHEFQVLIRRRFKQTAIIVATMAGDWHPGYLPTAGTYGRGIYQEIIASLASGSLELLIDVVIQEIRQLLADPQSTATEHVVLADSA